MNINQPSIWSSIEIECISMDFEYKQYINTHYDLNCKGQPVSEDMYNALKDAFFLEWLRDCSRRSDEYYAL